MDVAQKLNSGDTEDQIRIGQIIEEGMKSEFGKIIRSMLEGYIFNGLISSVGSDSRILGRAQGFAEFLADLDLKIENKDTLLTTRIDEAMQKEEESALVEDPNPRKKYFGFSGMIGGR